MFQPLLSKVDEKQYSRKKLKEGLVSFRLTYFAFALLYAAFAYLDVLLAGEHLSAFLFIRFGVVIPFLILVIVLSYHKNFHKWGQWVLLGSLVLGGSGISRMLILLPDTFSYYGGVFMVLFAGYFLLRLNTGFAMAGGLLNLGIFIGGYGVTHGNIPLDIWLIVSFLFGSNVIGIIGNHEFEKRGRALYKQEQEITRKNLQLEARVHYQKRELVQIGKAIESASDAIAIYDVKGEPTYKNQAFKELEELVSESFSYASIRDGSWEEEQVMMKEDGNRLVMLLQADEIKEDGITVGYMRIYKNITDRKIAEEEIEYLSFHDGLTGLYNRRFFDEEIKRINVAKNLPLTLIMLDVNGLKLTNDAFGHKAGDHLIMKFAHSLKEICSNDDIVARIGGDEFIILLPQTNEEEGRNILKRIKERVNSEKMEGIPIKMSVSCGCGTKTEEDENIADVFKAAEDQMYRSKISDRRSYRYQTIDLIMGTLYGKSPREQAHSRRVSMLCSALGKAMGIETDELSTAGMLHDIGKVSISESVLEKIEPLTKEEWNKIKMHPEVGWSILSAVVEYGILAETVLAHHEHWDGSGYPNGLKGASIPLHSRVIAIADAYDAMVNDRPYRKGMPHVDAMEEIKKNAGSQFDPKIVEVFLEMKEENPVLLFSSD